MRNQDSQQGSLFLIRMLFRHKYLVIVITLMGTGITGFWVNSLPDNYLASTKIMITPVREDVELVRQYRPNTSISPKEILLTEAEIVRSRPLISEALRNLKGGSAAVSEDSILTIRRIADGISVVPIRSTTMFKLMYSGSDPRFIVSFLNSLSEVYQNFRMAGEPDQLVMNRYNKQLVGIRNQLDSLFQVREQLISEFSIVEPDHEMNNSLNQRSKMNQEMRNLRYEIEDVKFQKAYLQKYFDLDFSDIHVALPVLNDNNYKELLSTFNRELNNLYKLRGEYKDDYPLVQNQEKMVISLLKRIEATIHSIWDELLTKESGLLSRLAILQNDMRHNTNNISMISNSKDLFYNIDNSIENLRAIYNKVIMKREELILSQKSIQQNFRVDIIEPAAVPSSPVGPRRKMTLLVAFFAYLFASVIAAYLIDTMNRKYLSPEVVSHDTGVPVLASVFLEKRG